MNIKKAKAKAAAKAKADEKRYQKQAEKESMEWLERMWEEDFISLLYW